MNLFQSVRSYLAMLGIRPNQSVMNVNFFKAELNIFAIVLSQWLYLIYEASTFGDFTKLIFVTFTYTMVAACFTLFATQRKHIFAMFDILEEIIEQRSENPTIKAMFMETNEKAEKWCKLGFFFLTKVTPFGFSVPKAIFIYFTYFTTDLGNDAFDLPYPTWFPFDWKNPLGYFAAVAITYITNVNMFLMATGILTSFFSGLFTMNTVINVIKNNLNEINEMVNLKENHLQAREQLCHFVETHTLLMQLINGILSVGEHLGGIFLGWATVVVCGVLLLIQMEISKPEIDFVELMVAIIELFDVFICLLVVCELGQRVTDLFGSIADEIEQFDWYLHPQGMKQMLLTILATTQRPLDMKCFGSISANRETIKKVANSGYSYFTVLRNFIK